MTPFFVAKLSLFVGAVGDKCTIPSHNFLFLPPWWEYLGGKIDSIGECSPSLADASGKVQLSNVWLVGLAVLDMLLRIAGFAAVISIIIAGFEHQFAMGDAQKAAAARRRIYNSLIGLAIALIATAAVTFIGNQLSS